MPKRKSSQDQEILEGKVIAVLSYLSILCIIPLVFKKDNKFVLCHSKQGLVIFVGQVALFVFHILLGDWLLRFGTFVLGVVSFIGIIAVLRGQYIQFPGISTIADKITL